MSVADGVLWLMSLAVDEHLATGTEPGPGHDVLTGRYACYDTYRAADGKWLAVAAIEAKFFANLCRALGCEQWIDHQYDDDVQDEVRRDFAAAFARRDRDDWVATLSGADTCVAPVQAVSEIGARPAVRLAAGAVVEAKHRRARHVPSGGAGAGRHGRRWPSRCACPTPTATDTDELLDGGRASIRRADRRAPRPEGGGMTRPTDVVDDDRGPSSASPSTRRPASSRSSAATSGPRARRWRTATPCSGTTPWPTSITDGPIAPPDDALGVVPPPSLGAGPRRAAHLPLQVHFDLKERLGLPEAVMTDNTIVFHEPGATRRRARPRARSCARSATRRRRSSGTGRFWVIDVEYTNQHGETVGVESYTGFGYRRARRRRRRRSAVVSRLATRARVRRRGRGRPPARRSPTT